MFGSHALGLKEGLQPTFVFIKLGRMQVQSAFCITRLHQVATISIYIRVNRQINFQNTFSGWADVFQIPNFINTWTLYAIPVSPRPDNYQQSGVQSGDQSDEKSEKIDGKLRWVASTSQLRAGEVYLSKESNRLVEVSRKFWQIKGKNNRKRGYFPVAPLVSSDWPGRSTS